MAKYDTSPDGPYGVHNGAGTNTTRGTIPKDAADADARGLTGQGHPASGSQSIDRMVKALDQIELTDQHTLHAFLQAGRALAHKIAVETSMASGELTAGGKEMAKGSGNPLLMGIDVRMKIRRVTKQMDAAAEHMAQAAAAYTATWTVFEREFEEILDRSRTKVKRPKLFSIDPQ
jgi:hypothetical protein